MVNWLIPTFDLPMSFTVLTWMAIITQFAVVLIPEVPGWRREAHRFIAFWSALFLLISLFVLVGHHTISGLAHYVSLASALGMALIFATLVISNAQHKYFLVLQGSFFALYFVALLTLTYTT